MIGGTFFEVVYLKGPARRVQVAGSSSSASTHVEISDGTVEIPRERKLELIADFARDFTVLSEVGSKDSEVVFAPDAVGRVDQGGARRRRLEGDHRGPRGRHRRRLPALRRDAHRASSTRSSHEVDRSPTSIFEAPTKASQAWFIKHFGPDVQPREHPARRGDPARDAPARAARRHAEGGAARWRAEPPAS